MAKTNWDQVQAAAERRRAAGEDTGLNKCPRGHKGLLNIFSVADDPLIGTILGEFGSQSTLALGLVYGPEGLDMVVARKSVSEDVLTDFYKGLKSKFHSLGKLRETATITSGLHAEMAIVRHCLEELKIKKWDLGDTLQIVCVGKPVCKDCAGWMNSHSIGHCSVSGSPPTISFACGGVSTMGGGIWESPSTGAVYGGGNDLNHYSKNGGTINKPLGT